MDVNATIESPWAESEAKRWPRRVRGDAFLRAAWKSAMFLHFSVPPETLRPEIPRRFKLELYDGLALVSLVAITMCGFRPYHRLSLAWLFRGIREQHFLNFRTYVRCHDEPGAFFLWGWLSQPLGMRLPSGLLALPYSFASVRYHYQEEEKVLSGTVFEAAAPGRFRFQADIPPALHHCPPGSLDAFALERYTGFFCHRHAARLFRTRHAPWRQVALRPEIQDASLISNRFPWFTEARLAGANFSPGFSEVLLGRPHRMSQRDDGKPRRILSGFYDLP